MPVNSSDIFLNATDVRNNARAYLIILQEVRAIEEAILFAADSGLLTAYIYNTYMSQTSIPAYTQITKPTIAMGTTTNPVFVLGSQIIIDGITVTLTGTSLIQTIIDINAASITNVVATSTSNHLTLTDSAGGDIIVSGAVATVAGLSNTYGAIDVTNNKITLLNHGFVNGDQILLTTTGTFPTPLAGGTIYFVRVLDTNTFQLCSSYMDTINNNPIILVTAGTGLLSIRKYSPQEQYFQAWQGQGNADANRPLIDQMNGVMSHFTNLGYTITQVQNPNVTAGNVFYWCVRW